MYGSDADLTIISFIHPYCVITDGSSCGMLTIAPKYYKYSIMSTVHYFHPISLPLRFTTRQSLALPRRSNTTSQLSIMPLTGTSLVMMLILLSANAQRIIEISPKVCGPKLGRCPIGSYCAANGKASGNGICIPRFCTNGICPLYSTCDYSGSGRAAIEGRCIQDLCNTRGKVKCPYVTPYTLY